MRALRAGVLAAALVVGGLVVPPVAGAAGGIVLTGSSTAYVDVRMPVSFQLIGATVTTSGRFGGVYAEQLTPEPKYGGPRAVAGYLAVRGLAYTLDDMRPFSFAGPGDFAPGVVRFYLLADRPTTVHIDVPRPEIDMTLRPVARAHAAVQVGSLRRTGDTWAGTLPMPVAKPVVAGVALQARGVLARHADVDLCLRDRDAACPPNPVPYVGEDMTWIGVPVSVDQESRWSVSYRAVPAPADRLVGSVTATHPLDLTHARMATFTLTVGR